MDRNVNSIKWPEWETVREIGRGSFGGVYEIQKQVFGHIDKAALKVITIPQSESEIEELYNDGYDSKSITARYKNYLEDIVKEYNLMADLKGNQNIVYCDDLRYVQHNDGIGWDIYIKMELLTPLAKSLKKTIEEQQVIKLGMDICNALIACKNKNIIHRDIKPQNIFVSQSGDYKLGDFGIAKTAERTAGGTKTGTYKYMAPEVYNNQPYGTSADLYSLGLVLYWMLNERRTPFLPLPPEVPTASQDNDARFRRMNGERIPAPLNGSQRLKEIVLKACEYNPSDRFSSPDEMLVALREISSGAARERSTYVNGNASSYGDETVNNSDSGTMGADSEKTYGNSWSDAESENTSKSTSGIHFNNNTEEKTQSAFDTYSQSRKSEIPKSVFGENKKRAPEQQVRQVKFVYDKNRYKNEDWTDVPDEHLLQYINKSIVSGVLYNLGMSFLMFVICATIASITFIWPIGFLGMFVFIISPFWPSHVSKNKKRAKEEWNKRHPENKK